MNNTDGNLYALRQYEKQQDDLALRDEAIEDKALEVQDKLLSVDSQYEKAFINDSKGNKRELSDFIADLEIDAGIFSEFLKECHCGQGSFFRNKIMEQLDRYCEDIATDLIDNEEPKECDYDTSKEYEDDM